VAGHPQAEVGRVVGGGLRGFIPFGNVAVWNILGDFSLSVAWSASIWLDLASLPKSTKSPMSAFTVPTGAPTASAIGLLGNVVIRNHGLRQGMDRG
jgi:hypothetical protein